MINGPVVKEEPLTPEDLIIEGDVEAGSQPIRSEGKILIKGSVLAYARVEAEKDIYIKGDVVHATVISKSGSIKIDGVVRGNLSYVSAFGNLQSKTILEGATVEAKGIILVEGSVLESTVVSWRRVYLKNPGAMIGGKLQGDDYMELSIAKPGEQKETELVLKSLLLKEIYKWIVKIDEEISEIETQSAKLQRAIELVRILGDAALRLPPEKKAELASQIKRKLELDQRKEELLKRKVNMLEKARILKEMDRRIVVTEKVEPGVKVNIEGSTNTVVFPWDGAVFVKRGIILIKKLDPLLYQEVAL